jgi:hypothetical protein
MKSRGFPAGGIASKNLRKKASSLPSHKPRSGGAFL